MALAAFDPGMPGFLPAQIEGLHVVTDRAKIGVGCELGRARKKKKNEHKSAEADNPFLFPLGDHGNLPSSGMRKFGMSLQGGILLQPFRSFSHSGFIDVIGTQA